MQIVVKETIFYIIMKNMKSRRRMSLPGKPAASCTNILSSSWRVSNMSVSRILPLWPPTSRLLRTPLNSGSTEPAETMQIKIGGEGGGGMFGSATAVFK